MCIRDRFTLVLSDTLSKERTFFTYLGANGRFDESDVDWDKLDCNILHIGYILLLNALDQDVYQRQVDGVLLAEEPQRLLRVAHAPCLRAQQRYVAQGDGEDEGQLRQCGPEDVEQLVDRCV